MSFRMRIPSFPFYLLFIKLHLVRNVYMLADYGDFVAGSTERDDPYLQFLATTDPAEGLPIYFP